MYTVINEKTWEFLSPADGDKMSFVRSKRPFDYKVTWLAQLAIKNAACPEDWEIVNMTLKEEWIPTGY